MDSGYFQGIATVIASVLASTISAAVSVWVGFRAVRLASAETHKKEVERLSKSTRAAIKSELTTISDIIRLNHYDRDIRAIVQSLREGRPNILVLSTVRPVGRVYQAILPNIGYLGAAATSTVRTYALIESLLEEKDTVAPHIPAVQQMVLGQTVPNATQLIAFLRDRHELILQKFELIQSSLEESLRLLSAESHDL